MKTTVRLSLIVQLCTHSYLFIYLFKEYSPCDIYDKLRGTTKPSDINLQQARHWTRCSIIVDSNLTEINLKHANSAEENTHWLAWCSLWFTAKLEQLQQSACWVPVLHWWSEARVSGTHHWSACHDKRKLKKQRSLWWDADVLRGRVVLIGGTSNDWDACSYQIFRLEWNSDTWGLH